MLWIQKRLIITGIHVPVQTESFSWAQAWIRSCPLLGQHGNPLKSNRHEYMEFNSADQWLPGAALALSTVCMLFHTGIATTLWGSFYYYPILQMEEKVRLRRLSNSPKPLRKESILTVEPRLSTTLASCTSQRAQGLCGRRKAAERLWVGAMLHTCVHHSPSLVWVPLDLCLKTVEIRTLNRYP